jgi:hypothetical protein
VSAAPRGERAVVPKLVFCAPFFLVSRLSNNRNYRWAASGRYFEVRLGRTLHENVPGIDKSPDGVATSIKSIDLKAATYQNAAGLTGRLAKYVNEGQSLWRISWEKTSFCLRT